VPSVILVTARDTPTQHYIKGRLFLVMFIVLERKKMIRLEMWILTLPFVQEELEGGTYDIIYDYRRPQR